METVRDVLKKAKKLGAKCTERTFWHYHKLRLLPEGQKISGRGNVAFFPGDTAVRIWLVYFLTAELGFSISEIARYPWAQFDIGNALSTFHGLPEDFVFGAKQKLQKSREDSLKHTMEGIRAVIGAVKDSEDVPVEQIHDKVQSGNTPLGIRQRKAVAEFQPKPYQRPNREDLLPDTGDDVEESDIATQVHRRSDRHGLLPD
jgi:hypothetical protein